MPRKKRRKKGFQKYVIVLVAGLMLFSGLFFGLRQPEAPSKDQSREYPIRFVEVQALEGLGEVTVQRRLRQVAAYVENPQALDSDDVLRILSGNYSHVTDVELESSNAYTVFIFYTPNPDQALETLGKQLILPEGKRLYQLYVGETSFGQAIIYGMNLSEEDNVNALLYQRKDGDALSLLGFAVTQPNSNSTPLTQ
ncbi:MAG: hypothetical protein GF334_12280 [Candidatus Altiarchaeales archaeon]|nr:hypothetical protein [Candidatus Altiarchaeales archaeon]